MRGEYLLRNLGSARGVTHLVAVFDVPVNHPAYALIPTYTARRRAGRWELVASWWEAGERMPRQVERVVGTDYPSKAATIAAANEHLRSVMREYPDLATTRTRGEMR